MLNTMISRFAVALASPAKALEREDGQTLAEYALILALVAAVVAVAVIFLQKQLSSIFSSIGSQL